MTLDGDQLVDVFETLESQGYSHNVGLSGMYRPGDIVQVMEAMPGGKEQMLPAPIIFLWASDCFPERSPRIAPFTLPQTSGTSSARLGLGANGVSAILPSLELDSAATVDYNLKLENVTVQTLAKGDLSGNLSPYCIEALERQVRAGDKADWFAVVLESVVSDKLLLEIKWKDATSVDARASIVKNMENDLVQLAKKEGKKLPVPEVNVGVKSEDAKRTIIETHGSVVFGYRARSMQRSIVEL